jgi:PKD repeat protein
MLFQFQMGLSVPFLPGKVLAVVGFLAVSITCHCQCPVIDFTGPLNACLDQNIQFAPSGSFSRYEWDLCAGELTATPTSTTSIGLPEAYGGKIEIVEEGGLYYGFMMSRQNGRLLRLDFGTSLGDAPTIVNLGNLGVNLATSRAIKIVKEGSEYVGFIIDLTTMYRTRFGASVALEPSPAEVVWSGAPLEYGIDLELIKDGDQRYLFSTNLSRLTRFSFPNSFLDDPSAITVDDIAVPGGTVMLGFSFIRDCDQWYAVVAWNTATLYKIHFAGGLNDAAPVSTEIVAAGFVPNSPANLKVVYDNAQYHVFVQSNNVPADLYRVDIGGSMSSTSYQGTNLGGLGINTALWGFSMHYVKSDWWTFSVDNVGDQVHRVNFPSSCFSNLKYSNESSPTVETKNSGAFNIVFTGEDAGGAIASVSKPMTVLTDVAPDIDFVSQNVCANHDVLFVSENESGNISNYSWTFGDSSPPAIDEDPVHQFGAEGTYTIRLDVTSTNGCVNTVEDDLKIFDEPIAVFDVPSGLLCTNTSLTFTNQTVDVYDGNLTYAWTVDGVPAGTGRDLQYSFNTTGDADVALLVAIPGCDDDEIKTFSNVQEGPIANFSVSGQCEDVPVQFTSEIPGAFTAVLWDFGDGQNDTGEDVQHDYLAGNFNAALHVEGTNGCITTVVHPLKVYSAPAADFSIDLPPFSCAGTPSQFHDGTPPPADSNLQTWDWSFGDGVLGAGSDPQHIYVLAGNYQVDLTVTTDRGCNTTFGNTVTIHASPDIGITHSVVCKDQPAGFTATTPSTVASWQWVIGSATYNQQAVSHTFQSSGAHDVRLTATAPNQCQSILEESVNVPLVPVFHFDVANPCEGQAAQFISNVTTEGEPISSYQWSFDGGAYVQGASVAYTFEQPGDYPVELLITGVTDCKYSHIQNTSIFLTPVAAFTPVEKYGPAPLAISFVNTSVGGSTYTWQFNDGSDAATTASPSHTFSSLGTYEVTLQATSEQGCQASTGGMVYVIVPHTDLSNEELSFVPVGSAGQVIAAVKVKNNSNYPIESFEVSIETGSGVVITETVDQTLPPMSEQTIMSANAFTFDQNGGFVCMTLRVAGDTNAGNDQRCQSTDGEAIVFEPYPNPTQGSLMIQFLGIANDEIEIRLVNQTGSDAYSKFVPVVPGLNVFTLDVSNLAPGLYVVRVITSASTLSSRVIIGQ